MKWIDSVRGNDSIREVARKAGINQATLSRQVNLDLLSYDVVRDVSRAYGRSVLSDLVTTGHLSHEDAGIGDIEAALHAATEEQLVAEVARRLDIPGATTLFDRPVSSAVADVTNVHQLRPSGDVSGDGQDAREAASESIEPLEGTDADFDNA